MSKALKPLPWESGRIPIESKGIEYFIEPYPSTDRLQRMEQIRLEMSFGMKAEDMKEQAKLACEYFDSNRLMSAMEAVARIRDASTTNERMANLVVHYCALCLNTENEDRVRYDEKAQNDKVTNLKTEGFFGQDFFVFAEYLMKRYAERFGKSTPNTSATRESQGSPTD